MTGHPHWQYSYSQTYTPLYILRYTYGYLHHGIPSLFIVSFVHTFFLSFLFEGSFQKKYDFVALVSFCFIACTFKGNVL